MITHPVRMIRRRIVRMRRRARRGATPHGLVLMYHRVGTAGVDPWDLCVSPERFAGQLARLTDRADIVGLDAIRDSLRAGRRARPIVAITFDDGYVDNLETAKPILRGHGAPATVFLTTGYIDRANSFWWDTLAAAALAGHPLPAQVRLETDGAGFSWTDRDLERTDAAGSAARRRLHYQIWTWLSKLSSAAREEAIRQLEAWIPEATRVEAGARPMRAAEVRNLVSDGLLTIGAHTVSHCMLSHLSTADKIAEIEQSRDECRQLTGSEPTCFAYPHGDLDRESIALVRSAGFRLACTSRAELVWSDTDPFTIPRMMVGDWTGDQLIDRLDREWLP